MARDSLTLSVGFQGAHGSFSDEAVSRIWGGRAVSVPLRDFPMVIDAVRIGDVSYAVLPIENSSIGPIVESRDAIAAAGDEVSVAGELTLAVSHCLIGHPGVSVERLRRVFSHPAALAQCSRFLAVHRAMSPIAAYDTAGSAADVALRGDDAEAAIAPYGAAARYGLEALALNIQDDADNATRFVILAPVQAGSYPAEWRPPVSLTTSAIIRNDGRDYA